MAVELKRISAEKHVNMLFPKRRKKVERLLKGKVSAEISSVRSAIAKQPYGFDRADLRWGVEFDDVYIEAMEAREGGSMIVNIRRPRSWLIIHVAIDSIDGAVTAQIVADEFLWRDDVLDALGIARWAS